MRVLALDTTTRAGSIALVDGERVLVERIGDASRSHAERLPGDLQRVVEAVHLTFADIDLFAVASGPGSFTGLRIGIATIQGLAFVERKQVVPVSVLFALALGAAADLSEGAIVGAWMDAHRREVFSALYRVTGAAPFDPDRVVELEPPAVGEPAATWTRWVREAQQPDTIAGDGAVQYAAVAGAPVNPAARRPTSILDVPLLATVIARVAAIRGARGDAVPPGGVQPLYVRRPDAEIARDAERQQTLERRP